MVLFLCTALGQQPLTGDTRVDRGEVRLEFRAGPQVAECPVHVDLTLSLPRAQLVGDRDHVHDTPLVAEVLLRAAATAHAAVLRALHDDHLVR